MSVWASSDPASWGLRPLCGCSGQPCPGHHENDYFHPPHPTPPYPRALTENPTCKSCLFKQAGGLTFKSWDCFCPSRLSRSDLSMCSSWCMLQLNLVVLVQALPPSGCWNISEFIDHPQALSAFGYPLSSLSHSVSSNYADHVNFFFFPIGNHMKLPLSLQEAFRRSHQTTAEWAGRLKGTEKDVDKATIYGYANHDQPRIYL